MQAETCQRVVRSYTRQRKIKVLSWIEYYRVPNTQLNTAIKIRPPTLEEPSAFFQILKSMIRSWRKPENMLKIIKQAGRDNSYRDAHISKKD